ncbi:MAG: TRAP transporter small permease [Alphaproteobacteria bacterium]|uniref:TRAP transporter small permease protein n=1 Tax=Peteryoungia algae TaxID=2919917 RepID=A0ABT0CXS0_9HYPH|nr:MULTISPECIES: TRAP transporter small permease subunit [unclassified Rhizobium]MBU2327688.1 TRAP transporter small permease [Alphaproteobacteria bacterium]MCC8932741.1 TRAP transporter small permease [Rhizobium sp. 'Codium 1']MCJ8237970.1 TRAP transporter small permease [Rhizobium sp. SSM4.3]
MTALSNLTNLLGRLNAAVLTLGLWLGAGALGIMLVFILVQVFFRYILGDALAWSEEASRFLMLWMTGLMVPTAFRQGGFVAITMILDIFPRVIGTIIALLFLGLSAVLLFVGMRIGWAEATGLGGRFAMPAIAVPTSLDLSTWMKVPRSWMMASLAAGVTMMFVVNIELILRGLLELFGRGERLQPITTFGGLGAE